MTYETSRWRQRPSLRHPRRGLAATSANGSVYAIAGFAQEGDPPFDTVEVRRPRGQGEWRLARPIPIPRANCAAATVGGRIYVVGGLAGMGDDLAALDAVHRFDPDTGRWEARRRLPASRFFAGAAGLGGLLYVGGGEVDGGRDASFLVYDPAVDRWSERAPLPPPRRSLPGLAATDRYIYAIGGFAKTDLTSPLVSVQRYDPVADSWQEVAPLALRRGNFGSVAFADRRRIIVVGGADVIGDQRPKLSTSEVYDAESDRWQLLDERLPKGRASLACALESADTVLAIGGVIPVDSGVRPTAAVHAIRIGAPDALRDPAPRATAPTQPRNLVRA